MNGDAGARGILASYEGAGGARVEVRDESEPYGYANVFHVKLRVLARYPGAEEPYERLLERMGVQDGDLERVRSELLRGFESTSLAYLLRADFPERLAERREKTRAKVPRFPVPS